jgi:hypothetical protein
MVFTIIGFKTDIAGKIVNKFRARTILNGSIFQMDISKWLLNYLKYILLTLKGAK